MFASASPDNIKQWTCPDGKFVQNLTGHNAIVNCMAVNSDGVLMSGANNGSIYAWDWRTGYNFQRMQVIMLYLCTKKNEYKNCYVTCHSIKPLIY